MCFQNCPQFIACIPFSQNLSNKGFFIKKKPKKKTKKNEQPWLALTLWFSKPWDALEALFVWFGPNGFPSKTMPCKLNHNLICLGPILSSKALATDLKLLINRNVQFHWTLLLGAMSKVTLKNFQHTTIDMVLVTKSKFRNKHKTKENNKQPTFP